MKIYIAAPWKEKELMPEIASKFMEAGHFITHKWWWVVEKERADWQLRQCAESDAQGVRSADCVVLINSSKSEGKAIEQGMAIALRLPIIAIGKRGEHSANVFHYLDNYIWCDDVDAAVDILKVGKVFWERHQS